MARIATLTMNPALDIATTTDRVVPEHKLRCEAPRYDPGGGGINVARAVHALGAGGALLVTAEQAERFPAIAVAAKSTVGAGDSMLAGIVLGLTRGLPIREALRLGIAAGAAALLGSGTQLCRREDVERLYAAARAERAPNR